MILFIVVRHVTPLNETKVLGIKTAAAISAFNYYVLIKHVFKTQLKCRGKYWLD